jgi:hypothetical protein
MQTRALGACGYVLVSSFLIRENILALVPVLLLATLELGKKLKPVYSSASCQFQITVNIHASLTFILAAAGVNTVPSMDAIYVLFVTLVMSDLTN